MRPVWSSYFKLVLHASLISRACRGESSFAVFSGLKGRSVVPQLVARRLKPLPRSKTLAYCLRGSAFIAACGQARRRLGLCSVRLDCELRESETESKPDQSHGHLG